MNDTPTEEDKPFHVIYTNGEFVRGFDTLELAREEARVWNHHALVNGRSERWLAIPKLNTPQEEL